MNKPPLTAEQVREQLAQVLPEFLGLLSMRSKVPKATISKIRSGETANPGIDTVARIVPHIRSVLAGQRRHINSAPAAMRAQTKEQK